MLKTKGLLECPSSRRNTENRSRMPRNHDNSNVSKILPLTTFKTIDLGGRKITDPLFSCSYPASPRLRSGVVRSLMGCKQYARMLGLSRGYPHILYLSLSKWDAAPSPKLFHRAEFPLKIRWHVEAVPPRICHRSSFSVACQVAVQNFRAAHASISARAELRRFRSEREKFRLSSRGHFSTAGPMAT